MAWSAVEQTTQNIWDVMSTLPKYAEAPAGGILARCPLSAHLGRTLCVHLTSRFTAGVQRCAHCIRHLTSFFQSGSTRHLVSSPVTLLITWRGSYRWFLLGLSSWFPVLSQLLPGAAERCQSAELNVVGPLCRRASNENQRGNFEQFSTGQLK